MIVEDERDESDTLPNNYFKSHPANPSDAADISRDPSFYSFSSYLERHGNIIDAYEHFRLKKALVSHLWHRKGYGIV